MANSKEQAVIDYLMTCPSVAGNPLFFNFAQAKDNNKQLLPLSNDKALDKPYIDGSVLKQFTFTFVDFKSVTYNAVISFQQGTTVLPGSNESVEDYLSVQDIIDWVTDQNNSKNFPDFGSQCSVQEIRALTDNPNLNGIDSNTKPALAKYSVSVQIVYLDKSEVIWG